MSQSNWTFNEIIKWALLNNIEMKVCINSMCIDMIKDTTYIIKFSCQDRYHTVQAWDFDELVRAVEYGHKKIFTNLCMKLPDNPTSNVGPQD